MIHCLSISRSTVSASQPISMFERCVAYCDYISDLGKHHEDHSLLYDWYWLGYFNALLHGTSAANVHKLQRGQNSMARAVTNLRRRHGLASLHWLPVAYRIQYKLAVTTFKVLTTQEPSYLSELILFHIPHTTFDPAAAITFSKIGSNLCSQKEHFVT